VNRTSLVFAIFIKTIVHSFSRLPLLYYENVVLDIIEKVSNVVGNLINVKLLRNLFYQAFENFRAEDLVQEIKKRVVGEWVRIFAVRSSKENFFELKLI
jgi:hypothetical protein